MRVALPHRNPRESHHVLPIVVHATCALTCLMLPRRSLDLDSNQLTSLDGVPFPANLTSESPSPIEGLESGILRLLSLSIPNRLRVHSSAQPPSTAVAVVPATCLLTCLMLPRRSLDLSYNQLTSLDGVTFPASLG